MMIIVCFFVFGEAKSAADMMQSQNFTPDSQ